MFHGVLLVNKHKNTTSHDIVKDVRSLLGQKEVGHAGTLDPMAEGLLVILCGMACKLSQYLLNQEKRYEVEVSFGIETDSLDITGKVLKKKEVSLDKKDLEELLKKETRTLTLPIPIFSAAKVEGKRLYSYAFKGEKDKVKIPEKEMSFYDLEIKKLEKDKALFAVSCSKGSFLRAFAHHLGQQTKTGACLSGLKRLSSGKFKVEDSLRVQELKEKLKTPIKEEENLKQTLKSSFLLPSEALPQFPEMSLNHQNARILKTGRIPSYIIKEQEDSQIDVNKKGKSQILKLVRDKQILALLEISPYEKIKILKNFPNQKL